jgi:hypothetical protein
MSNVDQNNAAALTTRKTVTVACKLPHGVVIRDFVKTVAHENVMGGGSRKIDVFRPVGKRIRIKGPQVPTPFLRLVEVVGGYAITDGIDAEVFSRWMNWNRDSQAVQSELIFGFEDRDKVIGMARERAAVKSGVEPLDVTMIHQNGRMVFKDERIARSGADVVMDNKVEDASLSLA